MRIARRALSVPLVAVVLAGAVSCTSSSAPITGTGTTNPPSSGSSSGSGSATSREVSFDADGTTTYGTLEVPAHRAGQRLAAAVLIPGSGPTDRDGNDASLGLKAATLRLVADQLAGQGIATLRYDKYFTGRTGGGKYAGRVTSITVTQFVRQADAAYAFLAGQSDVDRTKLLVVGHSEGGMIALAVAGSTTPRPAGLALLEPQDQRLLNLVDIQVDEAINSLVAQGTLTADQARTNAMLVTQAIRAFRAGQAVQVSGMATQVAALVSSTLTGPNANYVRSSDAVIPAELAAKVAAGTRVLVTVGTRDTNVPPRTVQPLMTALTAAGVSGPKLTVLSGLDHVLHLQSQPDDQAVLAPDAITALKSWAAPYATA